MFDNGLLKYYKDRLNLISGHLAFERLNFAVNKQDSITRTTYKVSAPNGDKFFLKVPIDQAEVECEVLLSQIYKKAGIKTPIYTPVAYEEKPRMFIPGVLSNNICTSRQVVSAKLFFDKLSCKAHCLKSDLYTGMFRQDQTLINFSKYFTKDALRDFIKIQVFDLASCNTDRNTGNFYFDVENGKVAHVFAIDQGMSAYRIRNKENRFLNYFGPEMLQSKEQIVESMTHNEIVNDLVNINDLAEQVGNVNSNKVAEDIKETIDYHIDKNYVSLLNASCQSVAEMLMH